jgi:hypothetical protein
VSEINSRIENIISYINEYKKNGKAALKEEMERINCGLENMGIMKL